MSTHITEHRPPEQELLARILDQAKEILLKYGLHVILAATIIVVAGLVYRIVALRQQEREDRASRLLTDLPDTSFLLFYTPEQDAVLGASMDRCKDMIDNQPETAATPWIMLKLGNLQAFAERWTEAARTYGRLIDEYPDSAAAEIARSARASALEQMGRYGEAAGVYENATGSALPRCLFDAGRCRELSGDADAAAKNYQQFLARENAPEELRQVARARLADLARGKLLSPPPELKPFLPAPAPPEPQLESTLQQPPGAVEPGQLPDENSGEQPKTDEVL